MTQNGKTREDLLAEGRANPVAMALSDQTDASMSEVIAIASENQGKGSNAAIARVIFKALHRHDQGGARAAIVRLHETDPSQGSREFDRPEGDFALPQTAVAARCNICQQAYARMIPFWYPCGNVIVQVDMCVDCAQGFIKSGHIPRGRYPTPDWA